MTAKNVYLNDTTLPYIKEVCLNNDENIIGILDTREEGTLKISKVDLFFKKDRITINAELLLDFEIKFEWIIVETPIWRVTIRRKKFLESDKRKSSNFYGEEKWRIPFSECEVELLQDSLFNSNNVEGGMK